jgi:hypothetical protein
MTFKDLEFKKHRVVEGIQATLEIKPKVFISVVAGDGMYSNGKTGNRAAVSKVEDVSSFEVAIIDENLPEEEQQWDVVGWQSREDINQLITDYSEKM